MVLDGFDNLVDERYHRPAAIFRTQPERVGSQRASVSRLSTVSRVSP